MEESRTIPTVADEILQAALAKCPALTPEDGQLRAVIHAVLCRHLGPVTARTMNTIREDIERARNILEDAMRYFTSECRRLSREENKN